MKKYIFLFMILALSINVGATQIGTKQIKDSAITTVKIDDAAVNDTKLESTLKAAIDSNTDKTTNQTHTGEVTGSIGLVLDPTCISGKADTTVVDADYFIFWDATDSTLKKVDAAELLSAVGGSAIADVTLEYKPYRIALNEAYTGYIDCQLVISDRSDYDTPIVDVDTATSQTSWLAYCAYSQSNEAWSSSGMPSTDVRSIIYIGASLTRGTIYYFRWRTYKHGDTGTATDYKSGMLCL